MINNVITSVPFDLRDCADSQHAAVTTTPSHHSPTTPLKTLPVPLCRLPHSSVCKASLCPAACIDVSCSLHGIQDVKALQAATCPYKLVCPHMVTL